MKKFFSGTFQYQPLWLLKQERQFIGMLLCFFLIAMFAYPYPQIAMWVGFIFAAYAAIANDSIQTIGTFLASNQHRKWWVLWIFIAGIFVLTVTYSWFLYDGDVSHQRLAAKGFEDAPTEFHFLQLAAPLFLIMLTRMRMPVSTTFLLLSSFAASGAGIGKVLFKSISGYFLAFILGFIVFIAVAKAVKGWIEKGEAHPAWTLAQWLTSGVLWSVWIMQDAANIAVYLPRSLSGFEFTAFCGVVVIGLGMLLYFKGGRIQKIVTEKSSVVDVRAATVIDMIYAVILFYFKLYNNVPMSTTWVFIGLLAGREVAMTIRRSGENSFLGTTKLVVKDASFAMIGLAISIGIALGVNPNVNLGEIGSSFSEQFVKFMDKLF